MRSGFWRKCRAGFRWCRRAVLAAVVALICAFVWFDRVGVPDFLQQRLVESARERGVELEFSRLRFSLIRGLIAENVRLGHTAADGSGSPAFSAQEVRLELDDSAVFRGRLQLDGLVLIQGKFVLPLSPTNALKLDGIQTELRFLENDTWSLDNFKAGFAGAQFALSGDIAHAPEIRGWAIFRGAGTGKGITRAQLKNFSDALGRIHFTGAPQLNLNFSGDARDVRSFNVRLAVTAPDVQSPWCGAHNFQFTARLTAPAGAPANFNALAGLWTNLQPFRLAWTARAAELKSGKFNADTVECDGVWRAPELAVTKLSAATGEWTPGLTVRDLEAVANLTAPASITTNFDASWSWWTNLQPCRLAWTARLAQLKSDKLNAEAISFGGFWRAPELALTNLSAQIGGGPLEGQASLNVATREFEFTNASRFDLHAVAASADGQDARTAGGNFMDAATVVARRRLADLARVDEPPARLARRSAADDSIARRTGFHEQRGARREH